MLDAGQVVNKVASCGSSVSQSRCVQVSKVCRYLDAGQVVNKVASCGSSVSQSRCVQVSKVCRYLKLSHYASKQSHCAHLCSHLLSYHYTQTSAGLIHRGLTSMFPHVHIDTFMSDLL